MTARRVRIGVALTGAALTCTGFAAVAAPANAAPAPATATTTATSSAATTSSVCHRYPWETKIYGEPKGLSSGSRSGVYLWRRGTFHLRVTHAVSHARRIYSGVITSTTPMRIQRYRLERGDTAKLSADHRSLVFVLANHGYLDGVDFEPGCAAHLTVSRLHVGSHRLPRTHVFLGHRRKNPHHVPFRVHRIRV